MRNCKFFVITLICMLCPVFGIQATTVMIDPASQQSPAAGGTVAVDVKIADVTDLFGYQFDLAFDKTALKFSGIQERDILKANGTNTFPLITFGAGEQLQSVSFSDVTADVAQAISSAGAMTIANARLLFNGQGVNGSGILVSIMFEVLEAKDSTLELQNVKLLDSKVQPIATVSVKGTITSGGIEPVPVIRDHEPGSPMLVLEATYDEANAVGYTYIDIWEGSVPIQAGQFLEFQLAIFSGNPVYSGSVDLHTSDGSNLRDSLSEDQNGLSAHPSTDLSEYARDNWYHRKISLDALAGKTLDGVMLATESRDQEHAEGIFRVYVDNIQITDGTNILTAIYIDDENIPITGTITSTEMNFAGTEGMSDYSVTIVGSTPVQPEGKLISLWGNIKSGR